MAWNQYKSGIIMKLVRAILHCIYLSSNVETGSFAVKDSIEIMVTVFLFAFKEFVRFILLPKIHFDSSNHCHKIAIEASKENTLQ